MWDSVCKAAELMMFSFHISCAFSYEFNTALIAMCVLHIFLLTEMVGILELMMMLPTEEMSSA